MQHIEGSNPNPIEGSNPNPIGEESSLRSETGSSTNLFQLGEDNRLKGLTSNTSFQGKVSTEGENSRLSKFLKGLGLLAKGIGGVIAFIPYAPLAVPGAIIGGFVGSYYEEKGSGKAPNLISHFSQYANSQTEAGILVGAIFPLAIAIQSFEQLGKL